MTKNRSCLVESERAKEEQTTTKRRVHVDAGRRSVHWGSEVARADDENWSRRVRLPEDATGRLVLVRRVEIAMRWIERGIWTVAKELRPFSKGLLRPLLPLPPLL